MAAEGRREAAVTHLALARTQNCRKRHFGFFKREIYGLQKNEMYKRCKGTKEMKIQKTENLQMISDKYTQDDIQMITYK